MRTRDSQCFGLNTIVVNNPACPGIFCGIIFCSSKNFKTAICYNFRACQRAILQLSVTVTIKCPAIRRITKDVA